MLSRVQSFCCPTCGNKIGEAQPVERLLDCSLTRQQRTIVELLSKNVGQWFSVGTLERALWDGSATKKALNTSAQSISAQISKMQSELRPTGWFIGSDRRGHYRLIPVEGRP